MKLTRNVRRIRILFKFEIYWVKRGKRRVYTQERRKEFRDTGERDCSETWGTPQCGIIIFLRPTNK